MFETSTAAPAPATATATATATAPKKFDFPAYSSKFPIISRSYIKPKRIAQQSLKTWYLTPWALALLPINYIQFGFLFEKHPHLPTISVVSHLKDSLSHTLTHFFPLAGRLHTKKTNLNPASYSVSVNCTDFPGVEVIHVIAKDITSAQVAAPYKDVDNPSLVESLYAFKGFMNHNGEVNVGVINHDGHTLPLLVVQVTELADGIFLSCAMNHSLADGRSFWHFIQSWAEISRKMMVEPRSDEEYSISRPAIIKNWYMEHHDPIIYLPSDFYDQISKNAPPPPPPYWDRVFRFLAESIDLLKEQANAECCNDNSISSFQALNAFVWRCLTRARKLGVDQETSCHLAVCDRTKVHPIPSDDQLGCFVQALSGTATAGELLANNLGWAAMVLHKAVVSHNSKKVGEFVKNMNTRPSSPEVFSANNMLVENSPRFKVYNNFGWGEPLTIRSGFGNKADGTMFVYPSPQGGGSIDIEMFLSPDSLTALLSDKEFMGVACSTQEN